MNTSWDGIKFICCREALVTVAYLDGVHKDGSPKYSIGFGSQDPPVKEGDTITIEDAFVRIKAHIAANDQIIGRAINVAISQSQWDAVASLYYQRGSEALHAVAALFNEGKPLSAVREFFNWSSGADGVITPGHTARRASEILVAIKGNYGDTSKYLLFNGNPHDPATPREYREFPSE